MATTDQLATLRLLVAEPTEATYSEESLAVLIDAAAGNLTLVARDVWVQKAAAAAGLADISEAGSSRSMGSIQERYLKMVAYFQKQLDDAEVEVIAATSGPRIRKLTR